VSVSRVATYVLLILGGVGIALSVLTVHQAGIGWDAVNDVDSAAAQLALHDSPVSLDEAYLVAPVADATGTLRFQLTNAVKFAITGGGLELDSTSPSTFVWLGTVSAMVAALSAGVLGITIARVLRNPVLGAYTFAALSVLPLWVGMAALNHRDTFVAVGVLLVTCALVLSMSPTISRPQLLVIGLLVFFGSALAIGTRTAAFLLIIFTLLAVIVLSVLLAQRNDRLRKLAALSAVFLIALIGAALVVLATNPVSRIDPLRWLLDAAVLAREYPNAMIVRVAGQELFSSDLPWWYIPAWLVAQMPLATLALMGLGLLGILLFIIRRKPGNGLSELQRLTPFAIPGLLIPVIFVITSVNLYDGLRHVLFMVPPLIVLSAVGLLWVSESIRRGNAARILAILGILSVSFSLFATIRWMPYSYAFINPIAGVIKEPRLWELDYWGVSAKEGIAELRSQGADIVYVMPAATMAKPFGGEGLDSIDTVSSTPATQLPGFYLFRRWDAKLPDGCAVTVVIARDGHILGEGGVCEDADRRTD
jgi:hypothetical protein